MNKMTNLRKVLWMVVSVLAIVAMALPAMAARNGSGGAPIVVQPTEDDSDRPEDPGGGPPNDYSRRNPDPSKGTGGSGDVYGDLWVVVRDVSDEWNGAPVLFEGCLQPYTHDVVADWDTTSITNSYGEQEEVTLIPLNDECEASEEDNDYITEVEFGRLNMGRTTPYVINSRYEEAVAAINSADSLAFDAAGRLVVVTGEETKTIDAPLENLGLYQQLMFALNGAQKEGVSPFPSAVLELADARNVDLLHLAAIFLAGAGDKGSEITTDIIVNVNNTLEINGLTGSEFYDFDGFTYDRETTYITRNNQDVGAFLLNPDTYQPQTVYLKDYEDMIFSGDWNGSDSGLINFVRAADEALEVITFIHAYAIP